MSQPTSTTTVSFSKNFIAGGLAGTIGAAVTCPLEVVKTRLQSSLYTKQTVTSTGPQFVWQHIRGVFDALVHIKRTEGVRALWKGLVPNLIGVVPARSIYFSVYQTSKHKYLDYMKESSFVHMLSAATAGTSTAIVTNPIWLIKTRMQLQQQNSLYKNSFDCLKQVIKNEGIKGLYRGFSASLLGLTESTLQFVMYEYFKQQITRKREIRWIETTAIASCSKLLAAILTYPHEVIRTRLRQQPVNGEVVYKSIVQSTKLIYKQEGIVGLYGGMTAHLLRVVPNAAILFLSYEVIIKLLS
jgi:solute carrier family 25 protein 33/36